MQAGCSWSCCCSCSCGWTIPIPRKRQAGDNNGWADCRLDKAMLAICSGERARNAPMLPMLQVAAATGCCGCGCCCRLDYQLGAITGQCIDGWIVWQLRLYLLVDARGQRNATLRFLANGYLRTLHKYSKRGRDSSSGSRSESGSSEHRHANPLEHLTDHIGPGQMNSWHSLSVSLFLRLGGRTPFCSPVETTNNKLT